MTVRPPLAERIAGAPISWGVCEVPGWGHQLDPEVVLAQMPEVGLGRDRVRPRRVPARRPRGQGGDPAPTTACGAVGQFVPVVLHDPGARPAARGRGRDGRPRRRRRLHRGHRRRDRRRGLRRPARRSTTRGWATLLANLDRLRDAAAARGLTATLHPHVGTMVESGEETDRVLAGSRDRPVPRHRAPAHRRRRPGRASPRAPRADRATSTSRTSASTCAREVQAGEVTYTEAVAGGHVRARSARVTSTSPRSSTPWRTAGTPGGTSSSRTPSSTGAARDRAGPGGRRPSVHRPPARRRAHPASSRSRGVVTVSPPPTRYDLVAMGRTGVDIYPLEHGVGLEDVADVPEVPRRQRHQRRGRRGPARPPRRARSPAPATTPSAATSTEALRGFGVDDRVRQRRSTGRPRR